MRQWGSAALAILLSAGGAAAEPVYLAGSHVCDGREWYDDWRLDQAEDGRVTVDAYADSPGAVDPGVLRLSGTEQAGEAVLADDAGVPRVGIALDAEGLSGEWLATGDTPEPGCQPFRLQRTVSMQARYDALLAVLAIQKPTVTDAAKVRATDRAPLRPALLADLDRAGYQQRIRDAVPGFWDRYRRAELQRLSTLPIRRPAEVDALRAELRQALAVESGGVPKDDAVRAIALRFLRLVADRLAEAGLAPSPAWPAAPGAPGLCARLGAFVAPDLEAIEYSVGLPVEYWDRGFTQQTLAQVGQCPQGPDLVRLLTEAYPGIEARQAAMRWLRQERDRLLAVPPTLDDLKQNNWLALDSQALVEHGVAGSDDPMDDNAYQRFAGRALHERRQEVVADGLRDIRAELDGATLATMSLYDADDLCWVRLGLGTGNSSEESEATYPECEAIAHGYMARMIAMVLQAQIDAIKAAPQSFTGLRNNNWFQFDESPFGLGKPRPGLRDYAPPMRLPGPLLYTDGFGLVGKLPLEVKERFEAEVGPLREQAITGAIREIQAAYEAADPARAAEPEAVSMCREVEPYDNLDRLAEACKALGEAFQQRRDEALCRAAAAGSGLDDAALARTVETPGMSLPRPMSLRDLICAATKKEIRLSFATAGMLWWQHQTIILRPAQLDSPVVISGTLEEAKEVVDVTTWRLSGLSIEGAGPEAEPLTPAQVLTCVLGGGACFGRSPPG